MLKNEIILVLGGARSGKSSYAEKMARDSGAEIFYAATSEIKDEEMRLRVEKHREQRPPEWQTLEEPLHPEHKLQQYIKPSSIVLLDCITLWVSNVMLNEELPFPGAGFEEKEVYMLEKVQRLIDLIKTGQAGAILVSNEIGTGIIPESPLVRAYRDVVGRVNQFCSGQASRVYMTYAGLPVDIKKLAESP